MSRTHLDQTPLQNALDLAGRVLFAVLFLPAGIGKLTGFAGTVGYISSAGLPLPSVGAALALTVEIVGSLALLAGWGTRWAALVLGLFTLAASFFFHPFWSVAPEQAYVLQEHRRGGGPAGAGRPRCRRLEPGRPQPPLRRPKDQALGRR